jgi:transcriptional regulator with XRE-family HTH domain
MKNRSLDEIKSMLSPDVVEQAESRAQAMLYAMELNDLRRARRITQEELAERLGTRQSNVSKLERRTDVRISTLRDVIEAMGGELQIVAHFADADYRIDQFERAAEAAD